MKKNLYKYLRLICLIIAVIFVIIGVIEQEYVDIFNKAKIICLECCGIG